VTVHDAEFAQDVAFIDMEYVQGRAISSLLLPGRPQPLDWTARIMEQLCETLEEAHGYGIVHRDVKPSNLMLLGGRDRGREFLKILDFGLSKIIDLKQDGAQGPAGPGWSFDVEEHEAPGAIVGTPAYMSPEQVRGDVTVDHRSDLYNVGTILYLFLTGYLPFDHGDLGGYRGVLTAKLERNPPPFAAKNPEIDVSKDLERLVLRCLSRSLEERPQSARELMEEFIWALPPRFAASGFQTQGADAARFRPPPGYVLLERLGKGGFGEVWKASDRVGIRVALKFLSVDEETTSRLEWEALQAMKNIRHANLCVPMMVWQTPDALIIGMELADSTLHSMLEEYRHRGLTGIPPEQLFAYLKDAARALDFLNIHRHELGSERIGHIYHCDVKPKNILLMGGSVKVADFGLAKLATHTTTAHTGGTYCYMAPECFNDRAARQTDQYSLAISYCELRGGRVPFVGTPMKIMNGHLDSEPDLSMIPKGERPAVRRALEKDPRKRWGSCTEFVEVLISASQSDVEPRQKGLRAWFSQVRSRIVGGAARPDGAVPATEPATTLPAVQEAILPQPSESTESHSVSSGEHRKDPDPPSTE
jgi:serine/threonine protein kinase